VKTLIIADKDMRNREEITRLFGSTGFDVAQADTVFEVLRDVLEKDAGVILLGSGFDDHSARDLLPLLKQCRRNLTIILVSNEESLPLLRRFRREGIFYHALKPETQEDREELLSAVRCAFANAS
jgi:FixJ family two-component response regulator